MKIVIAWHHLQLAAYNACTHYDCSIQEMRHSCTEIVKDVYALFGSTLCAQMLKGILGTGTQPAKFSYCMSE